MGSIANIVNNNTNIVRTILGLFEGDIWEASSIFMNEFWDFYIHMPSRLWM
jgi:hypothetical protein